MLIVHPTLGLKLPSFTKRNTWEEKAQSDINHSILKVKPFAQAFGIVSENFKEDELLVRRKPKYATITLAGWRRVYKQLGRSPVGSCGEGGSVQDAWDSFRRLGKGTGAFIYSVDIDKV